MGELFTLPVATLFIICLITGSENVFTAGFWLVRAIIFDRGKPTVCRKHGSRFEYKQQPGNHLLVGASSNLMQLGEK